METRVGEGTVVEVREKETVVTKETVTEGETRVVGEVELRRERRSRTRKSQVVMQRE